MVSIDTGTRSYSLVLPASCLNVLDWCKVTKPKDQFPQLMPFARSQHRQVTVRTKALICPIDEYLSDHIKKSLFGYKRFVENEVLLPRAVFNQLGLRQPAWVVISQKDQYLKYAIAYVGERAEDCAAVGPRFVPDEECTIQVAPTDET